MTILETVVVVSAVINVILLICVFYLVITISHITTFINQMHAGLANVVTRLFGMEQMVNKLGAGFTRFIQMTEGMLERISDDGEVGRVYRTTDGKFSARTLDELIAKIKESGEETEYFSDEELNKLKKLFEEDDSFDDEEE